MISFFFKLSLQFLLTVNVIHEILKVPKGTITFRRTTSFREKKKKKKIMIVSDRYRKMKKSL